MQIFPSMQLGGKPPALFDQARDGVVDIAWTLPGYTPGRFPRMEVFELPFVNGRSAMGTTMALQDYAAVWLGDELAQVQPLLIHSSAAGSVHVRSGPVAGLADMAGLKLRAPSRVMTQGLEALGATAIGMPIPEVPQALTTGVIDGALAPWEVLASLRLDEVAPYHTEIDAENGLYASVFLMVMNKARYEALAPDLRAVIDANSGATGAARAAAGYDRAEAAAREAVAARGKVTVVAGEAVQAWRDATAPVRAAWVDEMAARGDDGAAMLADAQAMIAAQAE